MKLQINFSYFDFFGKEVALNYNNNATVRTSFGGIFSLACLVTIILFFRSKAISFIDKDEIQVNSTRQFSNTPSLLTFPTDNFMAAVKIQQTNFINAPYYNISVSQRKYFLLPNGTRNTFSTSIQLEPCTLEHWSFMNTTSNLTQLYSSMAISDYLCFPKNKTLLIGGQYENPEYYFLKFQVQSCVNLTSDATDTWKPTCQSQTNVDTFSASNALFFTTDIYFTDYKIQTDNSLFFTTNYVNETKNVQEYGDFRPQYSIYSASAGKTYATFFFNRGRFTQNYTRQYMKFQDVLSALGGFAQVMLSMAAIVVGFYNSKSYILELANTFYDFDFEEDNKNDPRASKDSHSHTRHLDSPTNKEISNSVDQVDSNYGGKVQFKLSLSSSKNPDASFKEKLQQGQIMKANTSFGNENGQQQEENKKQFNNGNNLNRLPQETSLIQTNNHQEESRIQSKRNNATNYDLIQETYRSLIQKQSIDAVQEQGNDMPQLYKNGQIINGPDHLKQEDIQNYQASNGFSMQKELLDNQLQKQVVPIKNQKKEITNRVQITKNQGDEVIQVEDEQEQEYNYNKNTKPSDNEITINRQVKHVSSSQNDKAPQSQLLLPSKTGEQTEFDQKLPLHNNNNMSNDFKKSHGALTSPEQQTGRSSFLFPLNGEPELSVISSQGPIHFLQTQTAGILTDEVEERYTIQSMQPSKDISVSFSKQLFDPNDVTSFHQISNINSRNTINPKKEQDNLNIKKLLPAKSATNIGQHKRNKYPMNIAGIIQNRQLSFDKTEGQQQQQNQTKGDYIFTSLTEPEIEFKRSLQKKPSHFKLSDKNQSSSVTQNHHELAASCHQIGIIKTNSQQTQNETYNNEDIFTERQLNYSQAPPSDFKGSSLTSQVSSVQERNNFLKQELGTMNEKRKKIFYTFKYFMYKLSCGMLFCTAQNQMIDKAQSLVDNDLDIIKILDKIQEIDRIKCLILDYQQVVLFNYFPRPLVQLSELEKYKVLQRNQTQQINNAPKKIGNENNLLRTLFRAKQKFKQSLEKKNQSNIQNIVNYSSYHNKQKGGKGFAGDEIDYEKLYSSYKKISKKTDKSKQNQNSKHIFRFTMGIIGIQHLLYSLLLMVCLFLKD